MSKRLLANFYIALSAVIANKIRSLLTALGIIFGVAAVIAMLAIGNGAQQEILNQIKLVGVNNIVIKPIVEQKEEKIDQGDKKDKKKFSPGLTVRDVENIRIAVPGLSRVSPEILLDTYVLRAGYRRSAKLVGVDPAYFDIFNFGLATGQMFNKEQMIHGAPVCVIGNAIKSKFFPTEDPIGKTIKVGPNWLTIMGVLTERVVSTASITKLGIRDFNMDVYVPLQTMLVRYKNRDLITADAIRQAAQRSKGMFFVTGSSSSASAESEAEKKNYHQLDRLVIQVAETDKLQTTSEVVARLLGRRHSDVIDFEIEIPELLLKQQQRTNDIFNYVLGAIAGISLLVGGIGIMNIMLASVLERIKEIGLRLSIGAQKNDIIQQFLFEAVMISVSGGIIGVVLGITLAYVVSSVAGIPTIISFSSIVLSFGVAATVGLIFGIAPARRAANQDPIASLRYE